MRRSRRLAGLPPRLLPTKRSAADGCDETGKDGGMKRIKCVPRCTSKRLNADVYLRALVPRSTERIDMPAGAASVVIPVVVERILQLELAAASRSGPKYVPLNVQFIEKLLREYPTVIRRGYMWKGARLHNKTMPLFWLLVLCRAPLALLEYVQEKDPDVDFFSSFMDGADRISILHCASVVGIYDRDVLEFLHSLCPSAIRTKSTPELMLPLHYACIHCPDYTLIKFLLGKYPEACMHTDAQNRLPFDLALTFLAPLPVLNHLHTIHPESSRRRGFQGKTPLHRMLNQRTRDISGLEFLLRVTTPNDLLLPDRFGQTPLDLAASCQPPSIMSIIMNHVPHFVPAPVHGFTPLHYAVRSNRHTTSIAIIASRFPWMVVERDIYSGATALHLACESKVAGRQNCTATLNLMRCLIKQNPSVLYIVDDYGRDPLRHAEHKHAIPAITKLLQRESSKQRRRRWRQGTQLLV